MSLNSQANKELVTNVKKHHAVEYFAHIVSILKLFIVILKCL